MRTFNSQYFFFESFFSVKFLNTKKETQYQNQLYNLLHKKEYDKLNEKVDDEKKVENIAMNLKEKQGFKEFEQKAADSSKNLEYIRDRHLPKFIPFVNLADLEHPEE